MSVNQIEKAPTAPCCGVTIMGPHMLMLSTSLISTVSGQRGRRQISSVFLDWQQRITKDQRLMDTNMTGNFTVHWLQWTALVLALVLALVF